MTGLKRKVISILLSVSNLRANFQLLKLLHLFKEYNESAALQAELAELHRLAMESAEDNYDGPLAEKLFADFERLFEDRDGVAMQLKKLSNDQEVDIILLDCLRCDSPKIDFQGTPRAHHFFLSCMCYIAPLS